MGEPSLPGWTPRHGKTVLLDALAQGAPVFVVDAVRGHLGREPTSSELNAARRAAHRIADHGRADVSRVRQTTVSGATRQVLTLAPKGASQPSSGPPARRGRPRSDVQVARTLVNAVTSAGRTAEHLDVGRIQPDAAKDLADRLGQAVSELNQFEQGLRTRSITIP